MPAPYLPPPLLLFLSALLLAPIDPAPAEAPSFPSPQVARQHFELADRDMNVHWNSVRKTLPTPEYRLLQDSQRRWALRRDEMAASPQFTGTGGDTPHRSNSGPFLQTAADLTEQRGNWLKGVAEHWNKDSLSGVWDDGEGGRLQILLQNGKLAFQLETVRGLQSKTGSLSGTALWRQRIGWFEEPDGTGFCMILRQGRLELVSSAPSDRHHPEAGFDGNYYKIKELTTEAKSSLAGLLPTAP